MDNDTYKPSSLIKVLLVSLIIPTIGIIVSIFILKDINNSLASQELTDLFTLCNAVYSGQYNFEGIQEFINYCDDTQIVRLLLKGSLLAFAIGIFTPIIFFIFSKIAGTNRKRITSIFPSLLTLSTILLAISIVIQGAVLVVGIYLAESYWFGRVHIFIIGAVAIGALIGAIKLLESSFSFGGKLKTTVIGKGLTDEEAPKLFGFIKELSSELGSIAPNNIIIGLEPNFYVTSSDVYLANEQKNYSGETLYISSALARLLTVEELSAVIGHELGHFRGEDTKYSTKFAPLYAGLGNAILSISSENEGSSSLANLPAVTLLSYMYDVFNNNVSTISRVREFKADQAGVEASNALALSTALLKVSLYALFWNHLRQQNVEKLNQGKVSKNLGIVFEEFVKYGIESQDLDKIINSIKDFDIPHPTDTHPPVSERLSEIGIDINSIAKDMLTTPSDSAYSLIDNCEDWEEELTVFEHKLMYALGLVEHKNEEKKDENQLLTIMYCLAAKMISADGKIEENEIIVAEEIGRQLFEEFDATEFREYCNNPNRLLDILRMSAVLADILDADQKNIIIDYLHSIAKADGEVSIEEEELLSKIKTALMII